MCYYRDGYKVQWVSRNAFHVGDVCSGFEG